MKKSILILALLSTALVTQPASLYAAGLTAAEELAQVKRLSKYAKRQATSPLWPIGADPVADVESAQIGTATITASSAIYWYIDASKVLWTQANVNNKWHTYSLDLTTTTGWDASAVGWPAASVTFTLAQVKEDGAVPGSAGSLTLAGVKGSTGGAFTLAQFKDFLRSSSTSALIAAGTALNSSKAIANWTWTGKFLNNAGTGIVGTLDAEEIGYTLPITLADGTAISFTSGLSQMHLMNVAANSTAKTKIKFTSASRDISFEALPAVMVRSAPLSTGILNALVGLSTRYLAQQPDDSLTLYNTLPMAIDDVIGRFTSTTNVPFTTREAVKAKKDVTLDAFDITKFTTKVGGTKWGLLAQDGNITVASWSADQTIIKVRGTISTGVAEDFTCDVNGITTVKDDTHNVLEFTSPTGHIFWVKCFDSTGLDTSSNTDFGASNQDDLMAMALVQTLSGVASISASKADTLVD